MRRPITLFFVLFFLLSFSAIAIIVDDGRVVPTFQPPLNIFQKMTIFSSIAPNGLTCDDSADRTVTFFASTPTMNVGLQCGSTSQVLLYQTNPTTGLSYVGSSFKVNGVLPTFQNLQLGGLYYYFCYNCDNNIDTDCVGLDEGQRFCSKPTGQPWSVYNCVNGKKTFIKTCGATDDCQNTNSNGWDCVSGGTTTDTYFCLSSDKTTCTSRQGPLGTPVCFTGENTYITLTACNMAKQDFVCQPYSICLSSTNLFENKCVNNVLNQTTINCNTQGKYCDSTTASCTAYQTTGNASGTGTSSGPCRTIGQACDAKDYSGTALGHTYSSQCSTGFCWEDSWGTDSGECATPVCCYFGTTKRLSKNTCLASEILVSLAQCTLPDGTNLNEATLDASKSACASSTGELGLTNSTICNPITLANCPKKISISPDKVSSATNQDLFQSQCLSSAECSSNNCVSLQKLVDGKYLTLTEANAKVSQLKTIFAGSSVGTVGGVLTCAGALVVLGTATTLTSGLALTIGTPATLAACAGVGAGVGAIAGYWTSEGLNSINTGDLSKTGICIEQKTGFTGAISSIGKSINNLFHSSLSDETTGWIVIVAVGIILLIALTGGRR